MSTIPLRRPTGCLKNVLRQSRQGQTRTYANAIFKPPQQIPPAPPTAAPKIYTIANKTHYLNPSSKLYRTGFAVYTTPKTARARLGLPKPATHPHLVRPSPDPVAAHHAYQIRKMDPSGARSRLFSRDNPDSARPGDILLVTTRRAADPFAGVFVGLRRRGIETSILLRGELTKVGTEMWFKVYSRNVTGIEIIKRAARRARRAKITYVRKPKHDVGSVDHLVREWRRARAANTSVSVGKKKRRVRRNQEF